MKLGITRVRGIVSVTLMGSLFLGLAVSPALAADKVFESRQQNVTFPPTPFPAICGTAGPLALVFHILQSQLVMWDNGRFISSLNLQLRIIDAAGMVVARNTAAFVQLTGEGTLPMIQQFNQGVSCTGHSGTPGKQFRIHTGITFGEDGLIKSARLVSN